jgi:glucokinase
VGVLKKYGIGIDVGGTKAAYGLFDKDKKLIAQRRHGSDSSLEPAAFFDRIADEIKSILIEAGVSMGELLGVGIGMPSFIVFEEGRIIKTSNLTKIKDFAARDYLTEKLGGNIKIVIDNDAHTGALAEYRRGAGRGFDHMLYCPVSTGISSGMIIDGKLFRGTYGFSGESGHAIITPGKGVLCGCGNRGCFMSWCSGSMIVKHIQNWIAGGEKTIMTELAGGAGKITAFELEEAYFKNDELAIRAINQMVEYMAVWLFNLYVLLNINCFVFGGGLLKMKIPLLELVRKKFDDYNGNDMPVYFKTAELGENFGIIGAAELIYE